MAYIELTPTGKSLVNAITGFVQKGQDWIKDNILDSGIGSKFIESAKKVSNPSSIVDDYNNAKAGLTHYAETGEIKYDPVESSSSISGSGASGVPGASSVSKKVEEDPYKRYMDMVNAITDRNNAWSAAQAQKQMDFLQLS